MVKVYIDAGHGGNDPGAVGNGLREKDLTLKISKYTRDYLTDNYKGVQVRLSRTTDKTLSLRQRTNDANAWGADSLVSVHINASTSTATGYEDFIYNGEVSQGSINLQDLVHTEMKKVFKDFANRGQKRANFHMLRESRMPAVLPEFLFITNKKDADFLRKDSNLKTIAKHLAIAIAKFHKLSGKTTTTPKKTTPTTKPTNTAGNYTVKKGDTLWGIAKSFNTTVDAIKKANGLKSDLIHPGDKLKVTKGTTKKTTTNNTSKTSGTIKVGSKVMLSKSATKYATGQTIPSYIKGKTYTVQQVKSDRVLLREIVSWVYKKDVVGGTTTSKPKITTKTIDVNSKVKIKSSATKYATGQTIPSYVKNKTYTVMQVKSDRVLLKEIMSWVYKKDIQ